MQSGSIVELYGQRNGGKLLFTHSVIAEILLDDQKRNAFNVTVFDYAKQFSAQLLADLIRKKRDLSDSELTELLNSVQILNPITYEHAIKALRAMSYRIMSSRWEVYKKKIPKSTPIIIFMDVGSLLYYSGGDLAGHYRQSEMFKCLDSIRRCGSLIILLNHCKSVDEKCFEPALGRNWRTMVTTRFYFQKDDTGYFYVPIMRDQVPRKYCYYHP
ncbi:unnamed protein product [Bursaphelenchus xylophilus]|uniref:(pine wood nematode) hypothetical protein n=1 Tax=Bursaphelenchus xylophilus TaxID=6326 RepID=A0A1I7SU49_BURXY|nr:unnamed protein product [Bursaphelenchus xylophilus]CAG9107574.1 unnamed protein product [Bursaphelenchus xylophilus]